MFEEKTEIDVRNLVLGAGIAGLAYAGEFAREEVSVFEQGEKYGGLCQSFQVGDFIFDSAVHLSFTEDSSVRKEFDRTPFITHQPNCI